MSENTVVNSKACFFSFIYYNLTMFSITSSGNAIFKTKLQFHHPK